MDISQVIFLLLVVGLVMFVWGIGVGLVWNLGHTVMLKMDAIEVKAVEQAARHCMACTCDEEVHIPSILKNQAEVHEPRKWV